MSALPLALGGTIYVLIIAVLAPSAWGQSEKEPLPLIAPTAQVGRTVPAAEMSAAPLGDPLSSPEAESVSVPFASRPSNDEDVRFGRALAGSAMGAAVGGLLGAALIAGAEPDTREPYENNENDPKALGLLFIGGGAPVGAILHSRIPRDHTGAYVMAVLGELVVGGTSALLGTTLGGDSNWGPLVLGGTGVIVGAAGGAVLAAPDGPGGALHYENGSWHVQPPSVRVGIHRQPQPGLHGTVSLMSVEL